MTLVALLIAIILLLILAGITISQLIGDRLLRNAELAKEKYENSQKEENTILEDYEDSINEYIGGTINATSTKAISVEFKEPMDNNKYSVIINGANAGTHWGCINYIVREKTTNGFKIEAYNMFSSASGDLVANYIVIPYTEE